MHGWLEWYDVRIQRRMLENSEYGESENVVRVLNMYNGFVKVYCGYVEKERSLLMISSHICID